MTDSNQTPSNEENFMAALPKWDDNNIETYDANCHCGTVSYSVTLSPPLAEQKVVTCTCSICSRNGYLLVYPFRKHVEIKSGEDVLKSYSFGRKMNLHKFCTNCGSSVFFDPRMPEQGIEVDLLGVNVRMFKGVGQNVDKLNLIPFDGYNKWPFIESEHLK
ncbi:Mss4-like protein [Lophiotrema nucula]|uniref:Mss4-like protein n=1 Tax=Lophiotrema nucula TaxID=690887 RepID=A0A6A5ZE52_9PLEO|nr:Mss4-like protein [Lophiotrema nucula]